MKFRIILSVVLIGIVLLPLFFKPWEKQVTCNECKTPRIYAK